MGFVKTTLVCTMDPLRLLLSLSQCVLADIPANRFLFPPPSYSAAAHPWGSTTWQATVNAICAKSVGVPELFKKFLLHFSFSLTVLDLLYFFSYITAAAWLHSTSLARYPHRQPRSMHQLVRLPSGHPFLWWASYKSMDWHEEHHNRWSVKVICRAYNTMYILMYYICILIFQHVCMWMSYAVC